MCCPAISLLTDGRADSGRQYETVSAKSARLTSYSHKGKVILMLQNIPSFLQLRCRSDTDRDWRIRVISISEN